MKEYDAIVIGTGQSGPPLADRFDREGMTVAVIERQPPSLKIRLVTAALTLVLAWPAFAAEPPSDVARSILESKVHRLFAPWDRPDSPGAAVLAIRGGEILYRRGYGSAQLEYEIPITPATITPAACAISGTPTPAPPASSPPSKTWPSGSTTCAAGWSADPL